MKKCYRCNNILPFDNFHISNRSKDGYRPDCKECRKSDNNKQKEYIVEYRKNNKSYLDSNKKYRDNNKEFITKLKNDWNKSDDGRESKKKYYQRNKEIIKEKEKNHRDSNIEDYREHEKIRRSKPENKDKHLKYLKIHKSKNPHIYAWRSILTNTIKRLESKKSFKTIDMLGYSADELKIHIELLFTDGMNWDNYGKWHIDHKKPVSLFDKDTDVSIVNSLDNLQPMWAFDNQSKGNRFSN